MRGFFILFTLVILITCGVFSPAASAQESAAVFSDTGAIVPQWRSFASGISFLHGRITSPRLEFWALQIDLLSPNTRIVVRGGTIENGRTFSTRVSSFTRDNNLIAGINAVPFDNVSSREGQPILNMGIVISDGVVIAQANRHYDAIVFYDDGRAEIVSQSSIRSMENIKNAVGGFYKILSGGQPAQRTLNNEARHPRSAAGVSINGRRLYLLVIDGRRAGSVGATEHETALLLRSLGSWDGINFDGGGSSALAMRNSDGRIRVVNTPVHSGIPGQERAVAGCLGVTSY
ncbi:MAG: phosphodiester glycosidase family protein [Treponema sp.]|nr:phosphodiester glycosidase family protein [Treponema sp.]